MASTLPSCRLDTSAPNEASSAVMVRMSLSLGALVSVSGSSLSSVAGISVRQAFLAPAIGICPDSGPLPVTMIESICLVLASACFVRLGPIPRPGLRLAPPQIGLQRRLQPLLAALLWFRAFGGGGILCHAPSYISRQNASRLPLHPCRIASNDPRTMLP